MSDTFPNLLARLHHERFTGEIVFCFAEGQPKVAKFVRTESVRLESRVRIPAHEPLLVPLAIVHVKALSLIHI